MSSVEETCFMILMPVGNRVPINIPMGNIRKNEAMRRIVSSYLNIISSIAGRVYAYNNAMTKTPTEAFLDKSIGFFQILLKNPPIPIERRSEKSIVDMARVGKPRNNMNFCIRGISIIIKPNPKDEK
jgi:hypothetical protein